MIALVTDSTAYLTKEEAVRWGIRLVPMNYMVNGQHFKESYEDCNGDFESLIAQNGIMKCNTAQASITVFAETFAELVKQGFEVVCLVISSRLSGTYSCASIAAGNVDPEKISVVDSRSTAGGLALLVKYAADLIRKGFPRQVIIKKVKEMRDQSGIVFSVANMDALRRSGRIGALRQSVGTILNIRPILLCKDGVIVSDGVVRGRNEQVRELIARVPENASEVIVQVTGEGRNAMEELEKQLKKRVPHAVRDSRIIGPVIGINIGLDSIGVAWICD